MPSPERVSDPAPEMMPLRVSVAMPSGAKAPLPVRAMARSEEKLSEAARVPPPERVSPPAASPSLASEATFSVPAEMSVPPA